MRSVSIVLNDEAAPSPPPPPPPPTGGPSGQPVHVTYNVTVQVDGRAASTDRELLRFLKEGIKQGLRGNDVELQNAVRGLPEEAT